MEVVRRQQYLNFLIISFHAPLHSENEPEIVEFPCLRVSCRTLEIESMFHQFIKPIKCTSTYSSKQTGIKEEQLKAAYSLPQVLSLFHQWENEQKLWSDESTVIVTFGDYDFQYLLPLNCKLHTISLPPHMKRWVNIKKCSRFHPDKFMKEGLVAMVRNFGLIPEEGNTLGLTSCINIKLILCEFLKRNYVFLLTSSYRDSERDLSKKRSSVTPLTKPTSDVTFDRNISTPNRNDISATNERTPPNTPVARISPFDLKFPFPANKLMVHSSDRRGLPGVEWSSVVVKRAYAPTDRIVSQPTTRRASTPADWLVSEDTGRRLSFPSDRILGSRRTSAPPDLLRNKSPSRRASGPVDGTVSSGIEKISSVNERLLPDRRASAPVYRNITFDSDRRVSQSDDRGRTNETSSRPSFSTERRLSRRNDSTASDTIAIVCIEDMEECQMTNRRSLSYLPEETLSDKND